jgi:NADH:ubiquinone oxidoreductase subunit F (NADH-binding)
LSASSLPRLLAGARGPAAVDLDAHLRRFGPLPALGAPELIALVKASGLQGRGGAGFPTARKLRSVADAGRRPVVVANGVEGEPVSRKDKVLLGRAPHLVLDGAALAALALEAREAIIAIADGSGRAHETLELAIDERACRGERVSFRLEILPAGFVTGEETAVVNWLNGGPPKPTFTPPRPFERGVRGAPTLVQNVETFANLALVARFGPDWFREVGTEAEPGSALVTVTGAVARPGVYELPLGMPLRDVLDRAGGKSAALSALLVGGYFGGWVATRDALDLRLLEADLRPAGASLGVRAVVALPERACGVVESARIVRYLASESAGQCGPCLYGLDAVATALESLVSGEDRRGRRDDRLPRWLEQVRGRGACKHPDGVSGLTRSALTVFADEVDRHARGTCSGRHAGLLPAE